MGRFFGKVGFIKTVETKPDIWTEEIVEGDYYGNVNDLVGRWANKTDSLSEDVELNCEISIMADIYAEKNYPFIKYVIYDGVRWKVKSVRPNYPRIVLSIGGVYNGRAVGATGSTGN